MLSRVGERGATLLDAVVGTALMLVVFIGIVGAFQLTIAAVSNNKARAGAIALANERLEYIRSLQYDAIGTVGGIPAGALVQSATSTLNDITYTRRTFVSYEDDPGDGLAGADSNGIIVDYKAVKTSVSWQSRDGTHTITLVTRISPPNGIESAVPGGTLVVNVVNALAVPVSNAQVRIVNSTLNPQIDMTTFTDSAGIASVIGAPAGSGYQVSATKAGYSSAQTYSASSTNTNPTPAHLGVALNQTTSATFAIDLVSTKTIETFTPVTQGTTTDNFASSAQIASSSEMLVSGGVARLNTTDGAYPDHGMFISTVVSTSSLATWKTFSWIATTPADTDIIFRIHDAIGEIIPDSVLPGNSAGFSVSPVDLSNIATSSYSSLTVHGTLLSNDPAETPSIDSWSVSLESGPRSLPNLSFALTGAKSIGTGPSGTVYKYDQSLSSGASGASTLSNMEYDTYAINVPASTNFDVSSACGPQPEALAPNTTQTTRVYLSPHTTHSLLVDVKSAAGVLIPNATVRLSRGAYDTTLQADQCGQAFYSSLSSGTVGGGNPYTIDVSAAGYASYNSAEVNITGTTRLSIILN